MFRLALALGKSVGELESWSNSELHEWVAYYDLEPFGQERDNYHAGTIATVVAQVHGNKRSSVSDFMYKDPVDVAEDGVASFFSAMDGLKASGVIN